MSENDPTVLFEIPADAQNGILTAWGDNMGVYAVKFPDGRIVVGDQRLEPKEWKEAREARAP